MNCTEEIQRYPLAEAEKVAGEIVELLRPSCERIEIAGSIRRQKTSVKDIEIVYVPKVNFERDLFMVFTCIETILADKKIRSLEDQFIISRRWLSSGRGAYGRCNKLMVHCRSGIPVDLFATTEESWFNYLVCRTGPAELNKQICMEAMWRGFGWMPYGCGFRILSDGEVFPMASEKEVFDFVDIPYQEPHLRG